MRYLVVPVVGATALATEKVHVFDETGLCVLRMTPKRTDPCVGP